MKKAGALVAALACALLVPSTSFGGPDDASPCGQYHGVFGAPPGGGQAVAAAASSGAFQGGVVGELNSNPVCHS
jgi:hypothetical protein